MPDRPSVLFVCVRNAGKSQMAAALMRQQVGSNWAVYSAGTHPTGDLNALSIQVVEEVGASMTGEYPKPIAEQLATTVDHVILLGADVTLDPAWPVNAERWVTDEPSWRGIDGIERMRIIRDGLTGLVRELSGRDGPSAHCPTMGTGGYVSHSDAHISTNDRLHK